jgi:peptidoglycan/xylan/chitin deacetylase (PgdA/CDA1 family)
MRRFIAHTLLLAALALPAIARAGIPLPEDDSAVVILAYHRIGEDAFPEGNLATEQFAAHINELASGNYNIMTLPDAIKALKAGEKLPKRSIAITFEGAYTSSYENGMKLLLEKKIPFTVFISSGYADSNEGQYLHWEQLRELKNSGLVTFGILPAAYSRLMDKPEAEILGQINKAKVRFREELKMEPTLFSYPFGEYSLPFVALIKDQGFDAAFGLQSGVAYAASDFYALPRFTMTESFGDMERFELVSHALPLPVHDAEPADPSIDTDQPLIGFSVAAQLKSYLKSLTCFVSGQTQPDIELLGEARVELRPAEPLSEEKTRVNCTMPGPMADTGETQEWRWLGMLLVNRSFMEQETNTPPPPDALP